MMSDPLSFDFIDGYFAIPGVTAKRRHAAAIFADRLPTKSRPPRKRSSEKVFVKSVFPCRSQPLQPTVTER